MNKYIRHGVVSTEEILSLVKEHYGKNLPRPEFHGYEVGVSSLRMKTFEHNGLKCRACGLVASFFAVEDFFNNKIPAPHLNLYGVREDGEEVLFTHDHILARALGGANNLSNTQTMCSPCNNKKGRSENPQKKKKKENQIQKSEPDSEFKF